MEHLIELMTAPKVFVQKLKFSFEMLDLLGLNDEDILNDIIKLNKSSKANQSYDYERFINEELTELIENHTLGLHVNNRALLVDDICDSIWTICAKLNMSDIKQAVYDFDQARIAKVYPRDNKMIIAEIRHHKSKYDYVTILTRLLILSHYNSINIDAAFKALTEENMSKLNFPIGMIEEVLRDGKLQKKDLQGNFYPWYRPADFSVF